MKFNFSVKNKSRPTNYEGAKAYVLTPQLELYAAVVTAAFSDKFYESADTRLDRTKSQRNTKVN